MERAQRRADCATAVVSDRHRLVKLEYTVTETAKRQSKAGSADWIKRGGVFGVHGDDQTQRIARRSARKLRVWQPMLRSKYVFGDG